MVRHSLSLYWSLTFTIAGPVRSLTGKDRLSDLSIIPESKNGEKGAVAVRIVLLCVSDTFHSK